MRTSAATPETKQTKLLNGFQVEASTALRPKPHQLHPRGAEGGLLPPADREVLDGSLCVNGTRWPVITGSFTAV